MAVPALRRVVAAGVLAVAVLLGTLPQAPSASAAPLEGNDVSWPQCPRAQGGFDLPLPPASADFVIIGLTFGLPFTENPCLASQVAWARTNGVPAQAYTMAGFPTSAQLAAHGGSGPWSSSTRAGRLSNVGYAEARFALGALGRAGFSAEVVWIDVEPRPAQPWPVGTAARQRENRYVVEGLMRGLRDAGLGYGVYSYQAAWRDITGSWRLPGVPVWATAGRLDYPDEARDRCLQPSFSGGRVYVSQWYDDTRDYDITCGSYEFAPLPVPPSTLSGSTAEFTGDWNNDVLARVRSTGALVAYRGNGAGGWLSPVTVGRGWNRFDALDTVGDFDGDSALDVLARDAATGALWLYPGNGRGGWGTARQVGRGWAGMDAIVGPGDFTGDQRVDVLARHRATGRLWLYPGDGRGGWLTPRVVGQGWGGLDVLVGAGDVNGDGAADVVARQARTGQLWLYPGNGSGGWLTPVVLGRGWGVMSAIVGAGDFTGDRVVDVLARESATGALWLYPRSESGGWLPRVRVGTGWNALNAIF